MAAETDARVNEIFMDLQKDLYWDVHDALGDIKPPAEYRENRTLITAYMLGKADAALAVMRVFDALRISPPEMRVEALKREGLL